MKTIFYCLIASLMILAGCKKDEESNQTNNPPSGDMPCYSISHMFLILDSCKINNSSVYIEHHTYSDYITFVNDGSFDFNLEIVPPWTSTCPEQTVEVIMGAKIVSKHITHFNKDLKIVISGHIIGKKGDQIDFQISGHGKSLEIPYSWIKVN